MDNGQKKIMPGCEKLTRPEEISALRDYLRQGIQENEDSLVIGDENSLISTSGDPILAEVILDSQKKVLLDDTSVDIEIKKDKINLDVPGDKKVPGNFLNKLEISDETEKNILNPSESFIGLEDFSSQESLNTLKNQENSLNLLEEKNIEITKQILSLDSGEEPGIEGYREPLSASSEIDSSLFSFSSQLLDVSGFSEEFLSDTTVSISNKKDLNLEEKVLNLGIEEIKGKGEIPQKKVNLDAKEGVDLVSNTNKSLFNILENTPIPRESLDLIISSQSTINIEDNKKINLEGIEEGYPSPKILEDIQEKEITLESKLQELSNSDKEIIPEEFQEKITTFLSSNSLEDNDGVLLIPESETQEEASLSVSDIINSNDSLKKSNLIKKLGEKTSDIGELEISDELKLSTISREEIQKKETVVKKILEDIYIKGDIDDYIRKPIGDNTDNLVGNESELIIQKIPANANDSTNYAEDSNGNLDENPPQSINYLDNLNIDFNYQQTNSYLTEVFSKLNDLIEDSNFGGKEWSRKLLEFLKKSSLIFDYQSPISRPDHEDPFTSGSILNNLNFNDPTSLELSLGKTLINKDLPVSSLLRTLAELSAKSLSTSSSLVKQETIDYTLLILVQIRDSLIESLNLSPGKLPKKKESNKSFDGEDRIKEIDSWGIKSETEEDSPKKKNKKKRKSKETSENNVYLNKSKYNITLPGGEDKIELVRESKNIDNTIRNFPYIDSSGKIQQSQWEWGDNPEDKFTFLNKYLSGSTSSGSSQSTNYTALGLKTTLEDLILKVDTIPVGTLEGLKELLSQSPYFTTADKMKRMKMTLDSNHVWEIRLFPYLGDINGNCSWLPNISEINAENWVDHKVRTSWGPWIPATAFELQSRKMTQKTLGLYDGEISYPISMEFSNDVRLTLVDDQYKSWKRYFELCAECSTYLTEMVNKPGHQVTILNENGKAMYDSELELIKKDYTEITGDDLMSYTETTPIVKGVVCPGMYKNLSFRCLIYVMTPQLSTIQKFDLLLVLKDYSIEYSGEADSNSPDLNVSFSIVGENPYEAVSALEMERYNKEWKTGTKNPHQYEEEDRKKKEDYEKLQKYYVDNYSYDREKYGDWKYPFAPTKENVARVHIIS